VDVADSLERAEAELALLDEERERVERLRYVQAKALWRSQEVSPFVACSESQRSAAGPKDPATPRQVWKLRSLGVTKERAESYSKRQASVVISKMVRKQELVNCDND
jgi:hypothetical protein